MKHMTFLVLILTCANLFAAPTPTCPIKIEQGKSFGPLKIGMSRQEVEALGFAHKPSDTKLINQNVGVYTLHYNQQNQVIDILANLSELPDCVYVGKKKVPKNGSHKDYSKIFSRCGKEDIRKGGNLTKCEYIWIMIGGWGGKLPGATIRNHDASYGVAIAD